MMERIIIAGLLMPVLAGGIILLVRKSAAWIALTGSTLAFIAAISLLINDSFPEKISLTGLPAMPFLVSFDKQVLILLLVVNIVALFIFIYSKGYMKEEEGKVWFWSIMSLFLAAMNLLVISADWILFLFGWELMGLSSFLLIGTWHWRSDARKGAVKAFMITRSTDVFFYAGIFSIIINSGGSAINAQESFPFFAAIMLLIAVMGKSAQVPFQSWLSGAMAGPTPVSAFLHSATMVAAGVVLLIRVFPHLPHDSLLWIGAVGGITLLLTGFTALFSSDIKQMLAASTSSQLGFMLLAVGAGYPGAAIAHLVAHAFMKSSLFLGSGIFQHAYDSTSFEKLKGSGRKMKFTFAGFAIAGLALAGIPPLAGYFSKDAVLSASINSGMTQGYFPIALGGTLLTALYMGRGIGILWQDENPVAGKPSRWMKSGMAFLILFILGGGFFIEQLVQFAGLEFPKDETAKYSGLAAAVTGLLTGWFIRKNAFKTTFTRFLESDYETDKILQGIVVKPVFTIAFFIGNVEEKFNNALRTIGNSFLKLASAAGKSETGLNIFTNRTGRSGIRFSYLVEIFDNNAIGDSISGLIKLIKEGGTNGRRLQSGMIHRELLYSFIGLIVFIIIMFLI